MHRTKTGYRFYREVGRTNQGEAIFKDLLTGKLLIEKDHSYLVSPSPGELEGAKWYEEVKQR